MRRTSRSNDSACRPPPAVRRRTWHQPPSSTNALRVRGRGRSPAPCGGDSSVTCPMAIHEHARIAPCGLQFPAECPNSRTVVDGAGCAVAITIMPVPVSRETDSSFVVPTHQFFARRRPCRLTLHQWDDGRHAIAAPGLSTYVLDLDLRAVQPSCLVSPPPRSHPHTPPPSTPSLPQVAYTCCSWTSSARR